MIYRKRLLFLRTAPGNIELLKVYPRSIQDGCPEMPEISPPAHGIEEGSDTNYSDLHPGCFFLHVLSADE